MPVAAGLLLAACSGSSQPTTSTTPAPAPSPSSSPSSTAAPVTLAAARQAATKFLDLYAAGSYAAAWELIAPGLRKNISEAAWVGVHQACKNPSARMTYVISHGVLAGVPLVVFTVSPEVAHSKQLAFTYDDGAWGYDPSDGWIYFSHTFQQALATAKAKRRCNS